MIPEVNCQIELAFLKEERDAARKEVRVLRGQLEEMTRRWQSAHNRHGNAWRELLELRRERDLARSVAATHAVQPAPAPTPAPDPVESASRFALLEVDE